MSVATDGIRRGSNESRRVNDPIDQKNKKARTRYLAWFPTMDFDDHNVEVKSTEDGLAGKRTQNCVADATMTTIEDRI